MSNFTPSSTAEMVFSNVETKWNQLLKTTDNLTKNPNLVINL